MQSTIHLINIASPFREGMTNMKRPPSGILYVGGYLKKNGYKVKVHHINYRDIELVARKITNDSSALFVGFSVKTGKQVTYSALMSQQIKNFRNNLPVVWGGIHTSLLPDDCLRYPFIDYVVIGEGEITMLELTDYLSETKLQIEEIKGIGYKINGVNKINAPRPFAKNIDQFNQDWDLIDIKNYVRTYSDGRLKLDYITSRGCPHTCGFCYNQEFNKRKWRSHSVEFVINDLKKIKEKTGINVVSFDDDNFFTNRKRGLSILQELKKIGITCNWVELRIDYITEELIEQLVKLDVKSIFTGWESGNENTLKKVAKGYTLEKILEKTKILAKFKTLSADASAIIGFPWETKKDIDDTISLALKMFETKKFQLNFNIGLYVPYPGAPVSLDAAKKGFQFPTDYENWSKFDILSGEMEVPWFTRKQVNYYTLIDKYFKLLYIFPSLKFPFKQFSYIVAIMAYLRLKSRFLFFPFEVWITDRIKKRVYKKLDS